MRLGRGGMSGGGAEGSMRVWMRGRWKGCTLCCTRWVSFSIFISKSYLCSSRSQQTRPERGRGRGRGRGGGPPGDLGDGSFCHLKYMCAKTMNSLFHHPPRRALLHVDRGMLQTWTCVLTFASLEKDKEEAGRHSCPPAAGLPLEPRER